MSRPIEPYDQWRQVFWLELPRFLDNYGGQVIEPGEEYREFGRWSIRLRRTDRGGVDGVSVVILENPTSPTATSVAGTPLWFPIADSDIPNAARDVSIHLRGLGYSTYNP